MIKRFFMRGDMTHVFKMVINRYYLMTFEISTSDDGKLIIFLKISV